MNSVKQYVKDSLALFRSPLLTLAVQVPHRATLSLMRLSRGVQLRGGEMAEIQSAIRKRNPCRLLVFGLGNDSAFWARVNKRGKTVFIEDNAEWADRVMADIAHAECEIVHYETRREHWRRALETMPSFTLDWLGSRAKECYDVVIVDGPAGWAPATPGRMWSIAAARLLCATNGHVFVHDCDREVERACCDQVFSDWTLVKEVGRLRHYVPPRSSRPQTDG